MRPRLHFGARGRPAALAHRLLPTARGRLRPGEGTETKLVRDRQDHTFQVFLGAGGQREVTAKRNFLDEQGWPMDAESVLVAIVRRPLPPKEATWSVVLGVRDVTTDRVRVFFGEREANRLLSELERRVPAGRFGPLVRREFAVTRLKSLPAGLTGGFRR